MNTDPTERALQFTHELFTLMGYTSAQVENFIHPEVELHILKVDLGEQISAKQLDELTQSAQFLIRTAISQQLKLEHDQFQVSLDINNHLSELIAELKTKARLYADRAMTFGVPVRMEPTPAFQRKIIHTFLQKTPGIHTESFGVGTDRHIVISTTVD